MIKVIAFDLVGVLVREKDILLTEEESQLERLFGPNLNNEDYLEKAKFICKNKDIIGITLNIINKLYEVKDNNLFNKIKNKYQNIKIIVATNHLSYVKQFITNNFENKYLDDIIISADINKIKPNKDFYLYILNKFDIEPSELLFLDDNLDNICGAKDLGISTIKINKTTDIFKELSRYLDK